MLSQVQKSFSWEENLGKEDSGKKIQKTKMANIKILEERPITISEVKERIWENKNPIPKGIKTLAYLKSVSTLKEKKALELKEELEKLGLARLKDKHIVKLIDIMPTDMDSLKVILSQDVTLKQEDLQKILEVLKSY